MKKIACFTIHVLLTPFACYAQYHGGVNDGISWTNAGLQNATPSIYAGGANDGNASTSAANQNALPSIFLGGSNDGHAQISVAAQNALPGIYTGGQNDGVAFTSAPLQNASPGIFIGGVNDGVATVLSISQNPSAPIFLGGPYDGTAMQEVIAQNPTPAVYTGGPNDGYATAISIGQNPSSPLPVTLLFFHGYWSGDDAILEWKTGSEEHLHHLELERSDDGGKSFTSIATISSDKTTEPHEYRHVDVQAYYLPPAFLLYRLKSTGLSGKAVYSAVVKLAKNTVAPAFAAYPNPTTGMVTLSITNVREFQGYRYRVTSFDGKIVRQGEITQSDTPIDLRGLAASTFFIILLKENEPVQHFKILLIE